MLDVLRRKRIMKRVLWGLAIVIIPAFVLWGAGSLYRKDVPYRYIGTIGRRKINIDEFAKSIQNVRLGLYLSYFHQPEVLSKLQNDRKLINALAWENLLIKSRTKKEKIAVSDKEVVNFVTNHPLFVRDGVFDKKLYEYILKNAMGTSPRTFEEGARNFLTNVKYREDITKDISLSDEEVLQNYKNEFEKAKVYYAVIDKDNFKEGLEVTENEINIFYEGNRESFKEPEKAVLQYIAFPHEEGKNREEALGSLRGVYERIKARPRHMEKIARDLNLELYETAPFSRYEIVPEIKSRQDIGGLAFRLRPLRDALPIIDENETGTSYIVVVKERIPPRIKTKEEVRPFMVDTMKDAKAQVLARQEAAKMREEIEKLGISLAEAAAQRGIELKETELITRLEYIEEVGESYRIIDSAFKLTIGEVSEPIDIRKGAALIEPIEFQFIEDEKYEEEKEEYRAKVLTIRKMRAFDDWLTKVKEHSKLLVDLDEI